MPGRKQTGTCSSVAPVLPVLGLLLLLETVDHGRKLRQDLKGALVEFKLGGDELG